MKELFTAELEVISLNVEDILTTSIDLDDPNNYTPVDFGKPKK